MRRILIVDDDDAIRNLYRTRLGNEYDIVDTSDPERAVQMALEHKPDVILADLSMPKLTGFQLCQIFSDLSFTQDIPIFIVSGGDARNKIFCQNLGASRYFEKPIDFANLKSALSGVLPEKGRDKRAQPRIQMKVQLKLKGRNKEGRDVEVSAITENMSADGFLATCSAPLDDLLDVEVFLCSGTEHPLGCARAVRAEDSDPQHPRIGFQFVNTVRTRIVQ